MDWKKALHTVPVCRAFINFINHMAFDVADAIRKVADRACIACVNLIQGNGYLTN